MKDYLSPGVLAGRVLSGLGQANEAQMWTSQKLEKSFLVF